MPVPVATNKESRNGRRSVNVPSGGGMSTTSPGESSNKCGVKAPPSTRFRHSSKRLPSPGAEAIEYARVIDRPAIESVSETNCPGTNSNRSDLRRLENKVPDAGSDFHPLNQFRLHPVSLRPPHERAPPTHRSAPDARRAAPSLESPSPDAAARSSSTRRGKSRLRCIPSVRKYGMTITCRIPRPASVSTAPRKSGWPDSRNAVSTASYPLRRAN